MSFEFVGFVVVMGLWGWRGVDAPALLGRGRLHGQWVLIEDVQAVRGCAETGKFKTCRA